MGQVLAVGSAEDPRVSAALAGQQEAEAGFEEDSLVGQVLAFGSVEDPRVAALLARIEALIVDCPEGLTGYGEMLGMEEERMGLAGGLINGKVEGDGEQWLDMKEELMVGAWKEKAWLLLLGVAVGWICFDEED